VIRILLLLMIAYFLFPISVKVLSQYDMENILLGKNPAFCRQSVEFDRHMGKLYYGCFYRIVSVRKDVEPSGNDEGSIIVGPMVTYHTILHKLYFWTGDFFSEMQSLRVIQKHSDLPMII